MKELASKIKLEARPYGPNSLPEEIQALRERIYMYRDNIMMYVEVPCLSLFQLSIFAEEMHRLRKNYEHFYLIIDLEHVKVRPDAILRKKLRNLFSSLDNVEHIAVVTHGSMFYNIAAKFIMSSFKIKSFSIHSQFNEALNAIEKREKKNFSR